MHKIPPKKFKRTKHPAHTPIAILDTLRYRQVFNCPMNIFQIWNYLIATSPPAVDKFQKDLDQLVKEKKVLVKDGLYSLDKIDYEKAEKRRKHAEKLIAQARYIINYLKRIPWIEMLAVTGSVAAFSADEQSDVDIMVVTRPKRLWLTRLFLVSALKILGVYWNNKKPVGTICPNIYITSDNLTWNVNKQSLYIANEISLLYPIFFRHNCYFDFIKQNDWIENYLPNFNHHNDSSVIAIPPWREKQPRYNFIDLIEMTAMKIQMSYMKNKKTTEIVSRNFLHFNTHDTSSDILRKYQSVCLK